MKPKQCLIGLTCTGLASMYLIGPAARAQQPEPPKASAAHPSDPKRSAWLHEVYLREASAYEFSLDSQGHEKLQLRREPAMRWSSEGDYNGEVYIWTHNGAAAIVGCIFSGPHGGGGRQIMHEFHSLSSQPLATGERGGSGWHSQEAGIAPQRIADAPEPAEPRVLRLAQMRELARRFSAQVDRQGGMSEMRLLPQPIYRYEIRAEGPVVDGAVFAFVWTAGTDPEVLLVIEARRTEVGVRWYFAPARFTNREARVKYQGKPIWSVDAATSGIFDGVTTKRYGAFSVKTVFNPNASR
jgi:hypothetical protein